MRLKGIEIHAQACSPRNLAIRAGPENKTRAAVRACGRLEVQHQQREMQYLQNWKQHAHSVHSWRTQFSLLCTCVLSPYGVLSL